MKPVPSNPSRAGELCACETPVPYEQAVHKGAARTVCLTCKRPIRLALR
jgi:hypothetical protein